MVRLLPPAALLAVLLCAPPLPGREGLPGRVEVEKALERVFERPEFRPREKGVLGRISDWVREKKEQLLRWIGSLLGKAAGAPGVSTGLLILLIAALVYVLVRIVWMVLPSRGSLGRLRRAAARHPPDLQPGLTPEPRLRSAARLAAAGRHLEAARELYLGILFWLDREGRARYQDFKTGGEYAREISATPLGPPFRTLLHAFYPMAFGGRPASEEGYGRMRASANEMGVPE